MPAYRGIEKNEILKSIQQGLDLLQDLHIGSAADKRCSEWTNASPLASIEDATSDEALVAAMRNTGARVFFMPFYQALRFHALTDSASGGNKSSALDVYTMLNAWGAFALVRYPVGADIEAEVADYVLQRYLALYEKFDKEAMAKRLENVCEDLGDKELGVWLEDVIPLCMDLKRIGGTEEQINGVLNDMPGGGQIVTMVLDKIVDLDKREETMGIPTALSRYSVTIGALPDTQDMGARVAAVLKEMKELNLLASFAASDETCDIVYAGPVGAERELGLTLYCSKRAAQTWANAMPDRKIVNSKGQQVHAQPPPPEAFALPIFS